MRRDLPVYIRLCDLFDDEARHLIVLPAIWRSFTRSLETVLSIENIRYLVAYPWQDIATTEANLSPGESNQLRTELRSQPRESDATSFVNPFPAISVCVAYVDVTFEKSD